MRAHLVDSVLYRHLWGTDELRLILDDEGRVASWLRILAALAEAEAELGLIPAYAAADISTHADVRLLDLDRVGEQTRISGHSTIGLIRCLREVLPARSAEWVYHGATVQDLSDTWTALVMRAVSEVLQRDLRKAEHAAVELARRHRDTIMCGRTHGQPGLPITFGFKAAVWVAELRRHRARLAEARPRLEVAQLGGALGTMEFWGEQALPLLVGFAKRLGLGVPEMPWLTARDRVAEFVNLLGMVTATLAKIGQEVYDLQRPEIGELGEPSGDEQIGSITMPHKRNPERSEHLVTLARVVRSNAGVALESVVHSHERDGRAWKAEWLVLPEACLLTGAALALGCDLLAGLEVHAERMLANVLAQDGYLCSEPVLRLLAGRIGKHAAHEVLYQVTRTGRARGLDLRSALLEDSRVVEQLSVTEIDGCLDPVAALGAAGEFVDRVIALG